MTKDIHHPLGEIEAELEPADPARLIATLGLAQALKGHSELSGIILIVPWDAAWCGTVVESWQDIRETRAAYPSIFAGFVDWPVHRRWRAVDCQPRSRRFAEASDLPEVASATQRKEPVCLVSSDPDQHVDHDLLVAADIRLHLAAPTPEMVDHVVECLTGGRPSASLRPEACANLKPHTLRLAVRLKQSSDDYVWRLAKLTAPTDKATAKHSVVTLNDLHGMDEAASWGQTLAVDLGEYTKGNLPWTAVDRGVLLVGPPGVGKTTFAQALAQTCGVPLVAASYAEWQSAGGGHLGDVLKAMRATFEKARQQSPCILFVDEIDVFHSRFADSHHAEWWAAVTASLLELMDGIQKRDGVVVVAATNHAKVVEPALKRSGRLDRVIEISYPDQEGLAGILRMHLGEDLAGADLMVVAAYALGSTGADVERYVRGARRRARLADSPLLVEDVVAEIVGGDGLPVQRPRHLIIHEAGHALVMAIEQPGAMTHVTVVTKGAAAGTVAGCADLPLVDATVGIVIRQFLAGRAAEYVVSGWVTGGAGGPVESDLAQATRVAVAAETALGFSNRPLLWRGAWAGEPLASLLLTQPRLARRVNRRLVHEWYLVVALIREHRPALDAIVAELEKRPVLSGADVEAIVGKSATRQPRRWSWPPLVEGIAARIRLPGRVMANHGNVP